MRTSSYICLALCVILGVLAGSQYSKDWLPGYESLTAAKKMDYLWTRTKANTTPVPETTASQTIGTAAPAWMGGLDFQKVGSIVSWTHLHVKEPVNGTLISTSRRMFAGASGPFRGFHTFSSTGRACN